jgi:Ca2+-transporting ATPase
MENTPLQIKLNFLAELIAKLGSAAGLLLFVALLIRFFVQLGKNEPVRSVFPLSFSKINPQKIIGHRVKRVWHL